MATRAEKPSPGGLARAAIRLAALGLAGPLAAQEGETAAFERLAAGANAAVAAPTQLPLADGLVLELVAGEVVAVTPAGRRPLARSAPTGACRAFTRHPHGTVFVACERGLFVCDRDHLVLDGADLADGVPPGAPVGVHCDAAGRVWLCTERAFGVVDARFGFGRTFGAADGVPPGPYLGVTATAGASNAKLVLQTATGAFSYRPDRGPPPRLVADDTDPTTQFPTTPGPTSQRQPSLRRVTASSDGTVPIALRVAASGGATLRQRNVHHHLLRPIDGALTGLRPGRHTVEVHAVDRDLRRTVVARYRVHVPLPTRFDPRTLLPLAFGAVLLVFGLALWSARATGWRRVIVAGVRTALVAVVGLQLLAATLGYGRSWPFVGFSMYTENWHEGDVLHRARIYALTAAGEWLRREPHAIGVIQDGYWQVLGEVVHGDDARRDELWQLVKRSRQRDDPRFVGYVLVDGRIRLTRNGPVYAAPTVMVHYRTE